MKSLYFSISVALFLLIKQVYLSVTIPRPNLTLPLCPRNAEAILAWGEKLDFAKVGQYELELIKGISEVKATLLLKHRSEIIGEARKLKEESKYKAFQIIKGIGPKTALKLYKHLSLSPALRKNIACRPGSYSIKSDSK